MSHINILSTMQNFFKRWFVIIPLIILGGVFLYIGITFCVALLFDYKPDLNLKLPISPQKSEATIIETEHEFSVLSWNIGYAGLGKEQDFFYDGGKNVNPSSEEYQMYLNGIYNVIKKLDYADFILLQEVDIRSKRSEYVNQVELFADALTKMSYSFATNYNVKYIPIPFFKPMGKVEAGMVSLSRYLPASANRVGFDVNFNWWKRIFMLDRCIVVTRHKLTSGRELVMLNVHNSAFDDDNILKSVELQTIKKMMVQEYELGNFVVAGGDWNQNPPGFNLSNIDKSWNPTTIEHPISDTLFPAEWKWVFSPSVPTNRFNNQPFVKGKNKTTIIDFFLVSPNIFVNSVETINLDFSLSDHQPIMMTFDIAPDSTSIE